MTILLIVIFLGIAVFFGGALPVSIFVVALLFAYEIYLYVYFESDGFRKIRKDIETHIKNCNDLNDHITKLKLSYGNIKLSEIGEGDLIDDSKYDIKRKDWDKNKKSNQVRNCSALICKNASDQPFKYLCKYFGIKTTEQRLSEFERVLNDFDAAEQGKKLLVNERDSILNGVLFLIPPVISYLSKNRLIEKLGFKTVDLSDLYFPVYTFQYVSAGGNSSMRCDIKLNVENLDKFICYLSELVKFKKSIAGQRALMTSSLREKIKCRDNFTCQICQISILQERNLLLEIDHIHPISKGGMTSEDNLQTLCWKCNRSKGARINESML